MRSILSLLADAASRAIKDNLDNADAFCEMGMGADGTASKEIDLLAERAILEQLDTIGSDLNVLSEEAGFIDRGGNRTLVIDPLDGTYNSGRRSGPFAVSLAIGEKDTDGIEAALVKDIVTDTVYLAKKGEGATRNEKTLKCRPYSSDDSIFSIYLGRLATAESHDLSSKPRRVRYFGCVALELCFVAAGFLDGYYVSANEYSRNVRVTDLAAGVLILREAGGEIFDNKGGRFCMPLDLAERSSILAVGDKKALEDIL